MSSWVACRASPSLALLKYWGKQEAGDNLPATPSLAVTLGGLYTDTSVRLAEKDSLVVGGAPQDPGRSERFFDCLRSRLEVSHRFEASSVNSFPTAAGLASSSSGFAALAAACARAAGREVPLEDLSAIARIGSVSAARSVFGGFVLLPAGAHSARQVFDASHWPDLRIVAAVTRRGSKPVSSRDAMRETSERSPFYRDWVSHSQALLPGGASGAGETRPGKAGRCCPRQLQHDARGHACLPASHPLLAPGNSRRHPRLRGAAGPRRRRLGDRGCRAAGEDTLRGPGCRAGDQARDGECARN